MLFPMAVVPARFTRLGDYWVAWSILLGCGVTVMSTLVYFSWATSPLRQVRIAEVVGTPGDRVFVDSQPAQPGTTLSSGQQVFTLPDVRVGLQQADRILARLGGQSSAILESDCIQLGEGRLVVSSTVGCLGAAIASSETGIFVLERLGTLGAVKVLAGEVSLSIPSNPALGTIRLQANQKLTLSLTGEDIGPVRRMLPAEVDQIVRGELFQGFQQAIANQQTVSGLLPPVRPSPAPPRQPSVAQPAFPPADKVPAAPPPAHPPAVAERAAVTPASSSPDVIPRSSPAYTPSFTPESNPYPRSTRRRRVTEPSYETYTYRRKRSRSPYTGSYYRRRSPAYAAPAHAAPAPADPAPSLPSVPEVAVPELPTPLELPPSGPSITEPVSPPTLVEPPLEAPSGR